MVWQIIVFNFYLEKLCHLLFQSECIIDESLGTQVNGILDRLSTELPGDSLTNLLNDSSCANEITKQVMTCVTNHTSKTADRPPSNSGKFSTLSNPDGLFTCISPTKKVDNTASCLSDSRHPERPTSKKTPIKSPLKTCNKYSPNKATVVFVQDNPSSENSKSSSSQYRLVIWFVTMSSVYRMFSAIVPGFFYCSRLSDRNIIDRCWACRRYK